MKAFLVNFLVRSNKLSQNFFFDSCQIDTSSCNFQWGKSMLKRKMAHRVFVVETKVLRVTQHRESATLQKSQNGIKVWCGKVEQATGAQQIPRRFKELVRCLDVLNNLK
jgi:hypothetical protein